MRRACQAYDVAGKPKIINLTSTSRGAKRPKRGEILRSQSRVLSIAPAERRLRRCRQTARPAAPVARSPSEPSFDATAELAQKAGITFAQFVMMTPFPGTVDFLKWEKEQGDAIEKVDGVPLTRYWLLPGHRRPKLYAPHPTMSADEIRARTQKVWDKFYSMRAIWQRADCVKSLKAKLGFIFISKLYRQMYANTGIATDSARRKTSNRWARWLAKPCRALFIGQPMPDLKVPAPRTPMPVAAPSLVQLQ